MLTPTRLTSKNYRHLERNLKTFLNTSNSEIPNIVQGTTDRGVLETLQPRWLGHKSLNGGAHQMQNAKGPR